MKIQDLKVGVIAYTIQAEGPEGKILEMATKEKPRTLLFGMGRVMKSFADGLQGLEGGDSFAFTISPDGAFGYADDDKIMDVPLSVFMEDGKLREDLLEVGNTIALSDSNGHPLEAKILEIGDDKVTMDFNHPLAGKSLFVKGEVMEVRDPTIDEMNEAVEQRKCNHSHCHDHNCGEHECHEGEDHDCCSHCE